MNKEYKALLRHMRENELPSHSNLAELAKTLSNELQPIALEMAGRGMPTWEESHSGDLAPVGVYLWCDVSGVFDETQKALRWDGKTWWHRDGRQFFGRVYWWRDELPQITRNSYFE